MKQTKTSGEKLFDLLNYCFMIIMMIVCIYPLLYIAFGSVSDPRLLAQHHGFILKPLGFTLKGYELVFNNPNIISSYLNSFYYLVVGTLVNLFATAIGAYILSRKNVFWNNTLMFIIVFTMFFSGGLIPTFLIMKQLGFLNSRWVMIIPSAISTWNLIIMRTSFQSIPASLEESAKIDGANDFTVLFNIIFPLSLPIFAVMTLFYGVGHWNEWFNAMIYFTKRELYPLQLILREILIQNTTDNMTSSAGISQIDISIYKKLIQYATIMIATVPILCIYPYVQKHFTKGVLIGAIKE